VLALPLFAELTGNSQRRVVQSLRHFHGAAAVGGRRDARTVEVWLEVLRRDGGAGAVYCLAPPSCHFTPATSAGYNKVE